MRIVNDELLEALHTGRAVHIDLGTGGPASSGAFSVDHLELPGVDVVADLNTPLVGFPDNSVSRITSNHAFEHIENFMGLVREMHRIVKPGGRIDFRVPHFSNVFGHSDPTHVRLFGLYTMFYFVDPDKQPPTRRVPAFYSDVRFEIHEVKIEFYPWGTRVDSWFGPRMEKFFNKSIQRQHFYESRLAYIFPAWQVYYSMSPLKG